MVPLSSRGPAYDGRIKPELLAFGQGGSSGAAAIVSGIALLVQQAFSEKNQGQVPSSALVKAILLNSAHDTGRPQVDFECGFGNADAMAAISTVLENRLFSGTLSAGEIVKIPFSVSVDIQQVKATLNWNDPPAEVNATTALVNDLDLELHSPIGEIRLPWTLSNFPHADSLRLPARRSLDTLNNVEQITLELLTPGDYEIWVKGSRISAAGAQKFALAWQFDTLDRFNWVFPTGSDFLLPGKKNLLRWQSSLAQTAGTLSYRFLEDGDWQVIDNQAILSPGWLRWGTPERSGLAQLRLEAGNLEWRSDTFVVADQLRPKVGFDCPDSLLFFWEPMPEADDYAVFYLQDRYLELLAVTPDTHFIRDAAGKSVLHYAVAPRFQGKTGPLSYGFDYTKQGVGCYFKSFYLQSAQGGSADFGLELGTTYGLASATLEKEEGAAFLPIQTVAPLELVSLQLKDEALRQGVNRYRVRLSLQNGGELFSQTETVHYLEKDAYLLFPNPTAAGSTVHLLARQTSEARLRLFDSQGRMLLEMPFEDSIAPLPTGDLPAGCYFVEIKEEAGVWAGRFLIGR